MEFFLKITYKEFIYFILKENLIFKLIFFNTSLNPFFNITKSAGEKLRKISKLINRGTVLSNGGNNTPILRFLIIFKQKLEPKNLRV